MGYKNMFRSFFVVCFLFFALGFFSSCEEKVVKQKVAAKTPKPVKLEKHIHLFWTKGFPIEKVDLAASALVNYYGAKIIRMGEETIPTQYFNPRSGKACADSVIDLMARKYNSKEGNILLLTDKNISTKRELNGRTYEDFTIMGLSRVRYKSCVVSTYTMPGKKHESRFVKTVLHEMGHALGADHCKKSKNCLMRDLNGKGSAMDQHSDKMCSYCSKIVGLK
ncbi:MAG: hypothetical protein ACU4F9_11690 [Arcticibacter sp.]